MVLTASQRTAFFENNDQMGIPHEIMVQMQHEGIHSAAHLADFDKDSLQQLTNNLRKHGGRIPDSNPNPAEGARIPTQHSPMEPSHRRDWLWHVFSSGTIKLLEGTSQHQTSNGIK